MTIEIIKCKLAFIAYWWDVPSIINYIWMSIGKWIKEKSKRKVVNVKLKWKEHQFIHLVYLAHFLKALHFTSLHFSLPSFQVFWKQTKLNSYTLKLLFWERTANLFCLDDIILERMVFFRLDLLAQSGYSISYACFTLLQSLWTISHNLHIISRS